MTVDNKEWYEVIWTGVIEAGIPAKSCVRLTEERVAKLRKMGCTVRKVQDILVKRGWARNV